MTDYEKDYKKFYCNKIKKRKENASIMTLD